MHCGYVVKVEKLRPHSNANRLLVATFFGNDTCVSLETKVGDLGIYFPCDNQLSLDFCIKNHLLRKLPDGTPDTGYMDTDKRNVSAIRLRGEKSDGLYLPITCLESFGDITKLRVGDTIDTFNDHLICQKYIPRRNPPRTSARGGNKVRKKKVNIAPLFAEHADTEQLAYNLADFKPNDHIEITLKMHGTSARTGYLPVLKGYNDSFACQASNAIRHILNKMGSYHGEDKHDGDPIYEYDYVSGTRRTVLEDYEGGFYGSNKFREQYHELFRGKLHKGETIYYEIVGFTDTGSPIMGTCNNRKLNDKEFIKQYGEETTFSYGCDPRSIEEQEGFLAEDIGCGLIDYESCVKPQSDIYVYRMTMTNPDGEVVEYTPDFMRYRCEQMGVKTVLVFAKATIDCEGIHVYSPDKKLYSFVHETENIGETVREIAEKYYDGPDPVGKTHIREGVVVRIINRPSFTAYKHKNFAFKVLENIIKTEAEAPDMEEAEELKGEENEA